jgi:hypothetical protein
LKNVTFEIKNQTLNKFQLHKKWENLVIKKIKMIVSNFYGFKSPAHLNLHPICKHWCIAHKLDHNFFFFLFIANFFVFLFLFYKASMATIIHPQVHLIPMMMIIEIDLCELGIRSINGHHYNNFGF